jgi:hypothetical protein
MYSDDSAGETAKSLVPNVSLFDRALREVSIGIHHFARQPTGLDVPKEDIRL